MKYTQDMMLQSDSGYCMPFEEKGKDVELSMLISKCFDHYFQFMLRFYIQG